jgi:succinate dehydrogenase / fumarate reductase cytochrome b subunit
VIHVWQFRFGPAEDQGYVATFKDGQVRDLYRLVVEVLKNPVMATFYVISMLIMGVHIRHGIWSALQSLGLTSAANSRKLQVAGAILGVILAVGFLFIPIWIYFGVKI